MDGIIDFFEMKRIIIRRNLLIHFLVWKLKSNTNSWRLDIFSYTTNLSDLLRGSHLSFTTVETFLIFQPLIQHCFLCCCFHFNSVLKVAVLQSPHFFNYYSIFSKEKRKKLLRSDGDLFDTVAVATLMSKIVKEFNIFWGKKCHIILSVIRSNVSIVVVVTLWRDFY